MALDAHANDSGLVGTMSMLSLFLVAAPEIALDRGCSQKLLDPFRFVESLVDAKSDLRCKFEVNTPRNFAADVSAVAVKRAEHFLFVPSTKRHDVNCRQSQVGSHAN